MALDFQSKVDGLKFINVAGTSYIGTVEKKDDKYIIDNVVEISKGTPVSEAIKQWMVNEVTGQHQGLQLEGNGISISTREFSATQKMEVKILAMQGEYAAKNAVPNLKASAIGRL